MNDQGWVSQIISLAALAIGGWFARRITRPTSQQRAQHLAQIAADAAALVVSLNPTASWAAILEATVRQIANAAGLSITDRAAIERAAAGALARLGKLPNG